MNIPVYNLKNEEVGTTEVSDTLFNTPWNGVLLKQAFTVALANTRVQRSYPRGRGDVSGGGRKPWRQKGTGRARHGSVRSPLWKGGGVAFGGAIRNFAGKINKKERRAALAVLFSRRYRDGGLKVIDAFDANLAPKEARTCVKQLQGGKKTLLLTANDNKAFYRAVRNMTRLDTVRAGSLDVVQLMNHNAVLVEQKALSDIKL